MKKSVLIILAILVPLLSSGANLKNKTPEQVYEIYLKAVKKGDVDTVFECLSSEGSGPLPSKAEMKKMLPEARKLAPVSYKIVSKSENGDDQLTMMATGRAMNPFTMKRDDANGTIQMTKEDGVWKLISDIWMPKDMESQMQGFAESFTDSFSEMTNTTPAVTYHFGESTSPQAEDTQQEDPFSEQLAAYEKKVEKIQSLSASDKYKAQQIRKAASEYFNDLKTLHGLLKAQKRTDAAALVQDERKRLERSEEVVWAQETLTGTTSKQRKLSTTREPHTSKGKKPRKHIMPSSGTVTIEAEHFTDNKKRRSHRWKQIKSRDEDPEYMEAFPSSNTVIDPSEERFEKLSPALSYEVQFAAAGTYYMWICGKGQAGGATIVPGLDGTRLKSQGVGFFPHKYDWLNKYRDKSAVQFTIDSGGTHTINFWMQEDSFKFDRFVITTSSSYVPTDG